MSSEMCRLQEDMFASNWNIAAFEAMADPKGRPGRGTGVLRRAPGCNLRRKLPGSKRPFFLFLSLCGRGGLPLTRGRLAKAS